MVEQILIRHDSSYNHKRKTTMKRKVMVLSYSCQGHWLLMILWIFTFMLDVTFSFTVLPPPIFHAHSRKAKSHVSTTCLAVLLAPGVEVFDGSTIVDPIVVSGVFWTSLKAKLFSIFIGQVLATAVFGILASLAASQLPKLGQIVARNVFGEDETKKKRVSPPRLEVSSASNNRINSQLDPDFGKLVLCIVIDVIGTSSELIPFVGELTDIAWAPLAAIALRSLYGSNIVFVLEFVEEILPFTDILPLATLCWVVDTFYSDSDLAKALGLGLFSTKAVVTMSDPQVIDVESVDQSPHLLDKK